MRNVARLPDNDRGELFRNTADKMGLNDAIVEKDFWVCFTLDHLFHRCPWKDAITFKGGTSLSKAFNLISRFSEDIDLILDWRVLGYGKDEPWEKRSNTKQDADHPLAKELTPVSILDYTPPHAAASFLQTETTLPHTAPEERPHTSSIPSKRRTLYSSAKPPSEF